MRLGIKDFSSHIHYGGYGQLSREFIKALTGHFRTRIIGDHQEGFFDRSLYHPDNVTHFHQHFDVVLHISPPKAIPLNPRVKNIIYTQNALGDMRPDWLQFLKDFDHIIVPGKFDESVFSRYFKSVSICPQLVDNRLFRPIEKWRKENDNTFTFIFVGTMHYRKGFDLLIKSLSLAANQLNTRLKLFALLEPNNILSQFNYFVDLNTNRSKNLEVVYHLNSLTPDWIKRFYNRSDAFISLSRGEGWCMPAHEALLCGKPLIVPDSTAFREYLSFLPGVLSVNTKALEFDQILKTDFNRNWLAYYHTEQNKVFEADTAHCARQIAELVQNYEKHQDGTQRAKAFISNNYNQETVLENISKVIQGLA